MIKKKKPAQDILPKIISIEHCHACGKNMRIELDANLDGCHTIPCPHCGHEHYRVIENGKVTGDRWQSSGPIYMATVSAWNNSTSSSCSTSWIGLTSAT
jgi:DNA-directed RNA polymerase subunit RPC12/RpoP